MEHFFTTYVRTKTVFKQRLKDLKDYKFVKIYVYELVKLGVNHGPLLYSLKQRGEIDYDKDGNFRALKRGPIDISLLERTKKREKVVAPLTSLHVWMREQLRFVSLEVDRSLIPVYFKAFLDHRDKHLGTFFTVDAFSNRVHTPVVNLKGDLRKKLKFHGKAVVSLDVKQMQPTILAKVLLKAVGSNPFSTAIFGGEDVYVLLQETAQLASRSEAKTFLFRLIFGKPMDDIGSHFKGDNRWVEWINQYKSKVEPKNPHKEETHTNLAWLLQFSEVQVMAGIWERLRVAGIPFLTIHDDILTLKKHKDDAYHIMDEELRGHFPKFEIIVTG